MMYLHHWQRRESRSVFEGCFLGSRMCRFPHRGADGRWIRPHPRTRELLWSALTSNSEMRVLPVWGQFYGPKPRQNTTRWATRAHSFVSLTGLFMTFTWGNKTRYSRERPSRFLLVDDDYYKTYSTPYYLSKHNIKFLKSPQCLHLTLFRYCTVHHSS